MLNQEQQILEQINKANNVLITFNKTWNGDAVASALAMYLFLKKLDKKVDIIAEKFDQGRLYSFLPGYGNINNSIENLRKFVISLDISNAKVGQVKYTIEDDNLNFIISPKEGFFTHEDISSHADGFKYDLILVFDTPDLESLGAIYDNDTEFFYQIPLINIDHHSSNEEYGQINHVELTSVATAEVLFSLIINYSRDYLDEDIATCLLTGLISKTRSFKTQNITPHTLSVASQLIAVGARREEIVNYLYRSRSLNVLKLWGRVLARLTGDLGGKLVWSTLNDIDFDKTETSVNDLDEVVDELIINIPEAKVIVLIYKLPEINDETKLEATASKVDEDDNEDEEIAIQDSQNSTQALVYSMKNISSLDLVKEYKPTGTKNIAKISINKPVLELEKELMAHIKNKLEKLSI